MRQAGIDVRDCFTHDRFISVVTSFNSVIKRNNLNLFINTGRTAKMKIGRETSILEVNCNIIANISWSVESGKTVDFKEKLRYPLSPVLLIIAFPHGSKRSTPKSKLLKEFYVPDPLVSNIPQQIDAYVFDVMAKIRSLHGKPDSFEELDLKLIKCVPKGINEVLFVAHSYLHNSIKATERKTRGKKRGQL